MKPAFLKAIQDVESQEHGTLLSHVKKLVKISRDDMAKSYATWDANDMVFRSQRKKDKEDMTAEVKGDPGKMIVPLTFAQIMTFVAFSIMSVTQNRRFFELEPIRREEAVLEEVLELILEHDLRRNKWTAFLIQWFLDIGRFSLGCAEVCYVEESRKMRIPRVQQEKGAFGTPIEVQSNNYEDVLLFLGNKVFPVSPYRFLPDTRLPLTRFQEGEFCGSEELWSMARLRGDGHLFNLDKIPKMTEEQYRDRRKVSRIDLGPLNRDNPNLGSGQSTEGGRSTDGSAMVKSGPVVLTKMVLDITPKDYEEQYTTGGAGMGKEDFPVRYLCWFGNDKTIVRFEEAYYLHCQFPYICSQYTPDQHQTVNEGLSDLCDQLTNLITWKLNTHVASQRNSVLSRWAIDPAGVDIKSLESRDPYIRLKKGAASTDVRRYITQFKTEDVTQNAIADVGALKELTESITGWSAQMQGQYSSGRRSATQDRVVAQGAGARGKTVLGGIWDTGFEPLGKQLIVNNRQEMEFEDWYDIVGEREWPLNPLTQVPYTTDEVFTMFKSDPLKLAKTEMFFVFDGTSPSEKAFLAQNIQELLMEMMQNPTIMQVLGYGPEQMRELFNQVYLLRGVTPARLPAPQPIKPPAGVVPMPTQGQPTNEQPGSATATA